MNTSINTEEQVTVRNHNRSTALERSVLKYCGVYVWRGGGAGALNRFYGIRVYANRTSMYFCIKIISAPRVKFVQ